MEKNESALENGANFSAQTIDELQASLARITAMKQEILEALLKAKKKKLPEHVEKFRTILCNVIGMEKALREAHSAQEIEQLENSFQRLEREYGAYLSEPDDSVVKMKEWERCYSQKASACAIAAGLVGFLGTFAFLLCAVAYLVLLQIDRLGLSFTWKWLIASAAGVAGSLLLSLFLRLRSRRYTKLMKESFEGWRTLGTQRFRVAYLAYEAEQEYDREAEYRERTQVTSLELPNGALSFKRIKEGKSQRFQVDVNGNSSAILSAAVLGACAAVAAFLMGRRSRIAKKRGAKKSFKK